MRYSKQRETILDILKGTTRHPTAEWIYDQARELMPNISLGTVYRNLSQLDDQGSIRKIFDDGHVRYDGNIEAHDHFRCLECQRIYDISLADLNLSRDDFPDRLSMKGQFKVMQINLELLGLCNECETNDLTGDNEHGS